MFTLKGLFIILFSFLSWKIAEPISAHFPVYLFQFWIGLQLSITFITTGVMTKVFTILFPASEEKPERFFFIKLQSWVYILITIGAILGIIWFFFH